MRLTGNTPLLKSQEIQEIFHLPGLLVKDESANKFTGTWKDRRSELIKEIITHSQLSRLPHLCLISTGNSALSIARVCQDLRLQISALVDHQIDPEMQAALANSNVEIIPTSLAKISNSESANHLIQDQERKPLNITHDCHRAYSRLFHEIEAAEPNYVICPYGTGEALYGISLENSRIQNKHPAKIIGAKTRTDSKFAPGLTTFYSPYDNLLKEFEGQNNFNLVIEDHEIAAAYEQLKDHLSLSPSSAVSFAALKHLNLSPTDKVVVINSGKTKFQPEN